MFLRRITLALIVTVHLCISSTHKRIIRAATIKDTLAVNALYTEVMTSGPLTGLMGCGVASNDSNQVCYLQRRMVLTEGWVTQIFNYWHFSIAMFKFYD